MGELTEEKCYLVRSAYANSSWCWLPCLWRCELIFSFWYGAGRGDSLTKENLCPAFRQRMGGQGTLPASVDSELSSAQNNLYAKGAYLGMADPGCLQWLSKIVLGFDVWIFTKIEGSTYSFVYSHFCQGLPVCQTLGQKFKIEARSIYFALKGFQKKKETDREEKWVQYYAIDAAI